jgi:hypothetical protein
MKTFIKEDKYMRPLILVGKSSTDCNWEFQGVFSNPALALEAMRDEYHFASWVYVNEEHPQEVTEFVQITYSDLEAMAELWYDE